MATQTCIAMQLNSAGPVNVIIYEQIQEDNSFGCVSFEHAGIKRIK